MILYWSGKRSRNGNKREVLIQFDKRTSFSDGDLISAVHGWCRAHKSQRKVLPELPQLDGTKLKLNDNIKKATTDDIQKCVILKSNTTFTIYGWPICPTDWPVDFSPARCCKSHQSFLFEMTIVPKNLLRFCCSPNIVFVGVNHVMQKFSLSIQIC